RGQGTRTRSRDPPRRAVHVLRGRRGVVSRGLAAGGDRARVGQGSVLVWRVDDRRDRSTRAGARARMNRWVVLALFAAACGQKTTTTTSTGTPGGVIKSGVAEDGSLLPQLPKAVAVDTQKFAGVIVCD